MIITCPACDARFRLDEDALGETGRRLRCGRCKHAWHQAPLDSMPRDRAPVRQTPVRQDPVQRPDQGSTRPPSEASPRPRAPEPDAATDSLSRRLGDTEETRRQRLQEDQARDRLREEERRRGEHRPLNLDPRKPSSRAPLVVGWLLVLLLLGAVLASGWYFRDSVVAAIPEAARLYAALGIEAEAGRADGLEVQNVAFSEQEISGAPTLVVTGAVFNSSTSTRPVPTVVAVALDSTGKPLAEWRFRLAVLSLPPGGSEPFEARHPYPNHKGPISVTVSLQEPRR